MRETYYCPMISDDASLKDALQNKLQINLSNATTSDCILILAFFCNVISVEELVTFFHSFTFESAGKMIRRIVKKELMRPIELHRKAKKVSDGRTNTVYGLTHPGLDYIKNNLLPNLDSSDYSLPSPASAIHAYSVGFNCLSLLAYPYIRNICGIYNGPRKCSANPTLTETGEATVDLTIFANDESIYIRECTSSKDVHSLRDMLAIYDDPTVSELAPHKNMLMIISIKEPYISIMNNNDIRHRKNLRYSEKHLNAFIEVCNNYYTSANPTLDMIHNSISKVYTIPSSPATELVEQLYNDCKTLKNHSKNQITPQSNKEQIIHHLNTLSKYTNILYFYEYNSLQEDLFIKVRNELLNDILSGPLTKIFATDMVSPDIKYYLQGCRLFITPTCMFNQSIFLAQYSISPLRIIIENTLKMYFLGFNTDSYTSQLKPGNRDCELDFCTLNAYTWRSGIISIENLSYDISASIRLKEFMTSIFSWKDELHYVCLVRDYDDARYFYDLLNIEENEEADFCSRIFFLNVSSVLESISSDGTRLFPGRLSHKEYPLYHLSKSNHSEVVPIPPHSSRPTG